jgi:hypothetical protein
MYAIRDGAYVPALVQGPSKKKEGEFALKFEADGKLLTKPLTGIRMSSGKDTDGNDPRRRSRKRPHRQHEYEHALRQHCRTCTWRQNYLHPGTPLGGTGLAGTYPQLRCKRRRGLPQNAHTCGILHLRVEGLLARVVASPTGAGDDVSK